jgi:1D-myo-inositol 3-kinase
VAAPSFLAIGHVAKDLANGAWTIGGGVTYAALVARGLGYDAAVLTRVGEDVEPALRQTLAGVCLASLPSTTTTTFRNVYRAGRREQSLVATAGPLRAADVPDAWRMAPLVFLSPLLDELEDDLLDLFPRALLAVSAQGWFRGVEDSGRVFQRAWRSAEKTLARADVVVFSEEDVGGNRRLAESYAAVAKVLVLTEGDRGATLFVAGEPRHVPAYAAIEVDPTGAGDVFAAAFLIAHSEFHDPYQAARFASCAASFAVEQRGVAGVPRRDVIVRRLHAGT